jgi:zinc transporter, ZIP family
MNLNNLLPMAIPAVVTLGGGVLCEVALAVELCPASKMEHASGLLLIAAFATDSLFMYGLNLWTMRLEH